MIFTRQILATTILVLLTATSVFAKTKIPLGEREVLNKVHDLPDTEEFKLENGHYLDIGTIHTEFNIAYILPLYVTEEPRLVGFDEINEEYYDIPEAELNEILKEQNTTAEDINGLPFYTRYGGKLVVILIIGLIVWGNLPKKKENINPTNV